MSSSWWSKINLKINIQCAVTDVHLAQLQLLSVSKHKMGGGTKNTDVMAGDTDSSKLEY